MRGEQCGWRRPSVGPVAGVFVAMWFCGWGALSAPGLSVDELRSISQAHEDMLQAGTLTYTSHVSRPPAPPIPPDILLKSPGHDKVEEANRVTKTREQLWFDNQTGIWKLQRSDLRDINALMQSFQIPAFQRAAVSTTSTCLTRVRNPAKAQDYAVEFYPISRSLVIVGVPARAAIQPPLHTGIIPSEALTGQARVSITEIQWRGAPAVEVVISRTSQSIAYIIDPELGYRFRQLIMKDGNGRIVRQITASDYRQVGDILYPFKWEERSFVPGFDEMSTDRIINVEFASFKPQPDDAFLLNVPAGTKVYNMMGAVRGVFRITMDQTIDFESAPQLGPSDTCIP